MDHILRPHLAYTATYLDDIVIFSPSWEDHLEHLAKVFKTIAEAGLTINPEKCMIAAKSIQYLGYTIKEGLIEPQMSKVEAILNIPIPSNKKEIRSFLGLVGYYRRFIPRFSELASPLTEMLKKGRSVDPEKWTKEEHHSFEVLRKTLCKHPVLLCPDFTKPFVLQTDASGYGLGAVLSQSDAENAVKPVVFISRKLLPRELHYATIEKECLAIKWALETLQYYLLGRTFTLVTDHAPLVWLSRNKDTNSRVLRWFLALQPFSFQTVHRPGRMQSNVDYLSRTPCTNWPDRPLSREGYCGRGPIIEGKMAAGLRHNSREVGAPVFGAGAPEKEEPEGQSRRKPGGEEGDWRRLEEESWWTPEDRTAREDGLEAEKRDGEDGPTQDDGGSEGCWRKERRPSREETLWSA